MGTQLVSVVLASLVGLLGLMTLAFVAPDSLLNRQLWWMLAGAGLALLGGGLAIALSMRSLSAYSSIIQHLQSGLQQLAQGNDLEGTPEMKRLMNLPAEWRQATQFAGLIGAREHRLQSFLVALHQGQLEASLKTANENDLSFLAAEHLRTRLLETSRQADQAQWLQNALTELGIVLENPPSTLQQAALAVLSRLLPQTQLGIFKANLQANELQLQHQQGDLGAELGANAVPLEKNLLARTWKSQRRQHDDHPAADLLRLTNPKAARMNPEFHAVWPLPKGDVAWGVLCAVFCRPAQAHEVALLDVVIPALAARLSASELSSEANTHRELAAAANARLQQTEAQLAEVQAQAAKAQQHSSGLERRLHLLTEGLNHASIWAETDATGLLRSVSPGLERLTGVPAAASQQQPLHSLWAQATVNPDFGQLLERLKQGRAWNGELKLKGANEPWIEAHILPQLNSEQALEGLLLVGFDSSLMKAQESQLLGALNSSLEQAKELQAKTQALESAQQQMRETQLELDNQIASLNASAIVSETDLKGNIIRVNDQFMRISGYEAEELLGRNHRILKSGHQPDAVFQHLWRSIAGGIVWKGELKNRAKDGSYYWVAATINPVKDADGKPYRYVAVAFDITAQKLQEEQISAALEISKSQESELRESARELQEAHEEMRGAQVEMRGLVNALHNAGLVVETDVQGTVQYVNSAFCELYGYRPEELQGRNLRLLKSGEHDRDFFTVLWQTIAQGQVWRGRLCNKHRDGSLRWQETTLTPVLGFDGKPIRYISVGFDVTAQISIQHRLQESLEKARQNERVLREESEELLSRFRELEHSIGATQTGSFAFELDLQGKVLSANDALLQRTGFEREELVGQSFENLLAGGRTRVLREVLRSLLRYQVWRGELQSVTKAGEEFWTQVTLSSVLDKNGKPFKFVALANDISQVLAQEEKLREAIRLGQDQYSELAQRETVLHQQLNQLPGVVYRRNRSGSRSLLFANALWVQLTGISPSGLGPDAAQGYDSLMLEADRERALAMMEAALDEKRVFQVRYRLAPPGKEPFWVLDVGHAFRIEGAEHVVGLLVPYPESAPEAAPQAPDTREVQQLTAELRKLQRNVVAYRSELDRLENEFQTVQHTLDAELTRLVDYYETQLASRELALRKALLRG